MKNTRILAYLLPALFILTIKCGHREDHPMTRGHSFHDIDRYERKFEDPAREAWQKPDEVVRTMGLRDGDNVADVGGGTGYFTRRFAKAVAPRGTATGYDIEPNMVEYMRNDARRLGYANYRAELVSAKDPAYPSGRFDVVFMCNVYHHIEDRTAFLRAVGKALKRPGRIVIVDQKMEPVEGPPRHLRLEKKKVIAELDGAGFALVKDADFLPQQYYLEFRVR